MARITGFMYSNQTLTNVEGGNIVREVSMPLPSIPIIAKPAEKSFSISFCMDNIDTTRDHELHIAFVHEDKTVIDFGRNKLETGKIERELFLNIDIRNLRVEEEGEYFTIVEMDDSVLGRYPISIRYVGETEDIK